MTVQELIAELQQLSPEALVVLQRDPEGNGYAPMSYCWSGAYEDEYGQAGLSELTDEDRAAGYSELDVVRGKPAIIFCPVR
jgi:hypothetical protein